MHAVLHLQSDWSYAEAHQSFEQTLVEARLRRLLAHDDRSELTMITNQNHMLRPLENRNQSFWLCGLSCFVNKYLSESDISYSSIESSNASSTNYICCFQYFIFSLMFEVFKLFFLFFCQFALLLSQLD